MSILKLNPGKTSLAQLAEIYWHELPVGLNRQCRANVEKAAGLVAAVAAGDAPVYGVNTGFGKLANIKIAIGDTAKPQRNLIMSHCCGVGEPLPRRITRLMMVLKLLFFGRGASGVRWQAIELLGNMQAR